MNKLTITIEFPTDMTGAEAFGLMTGKPLVEADPGLANALDEMGAALKDVVLWESEDRKIYPTPRVNEHIPDRNIVLTSEPPQYYCSNPDCYSHDCYWDGWTDV